MDAVYLQPWFAVAEGSTNTCAPSVLSVPSAPPPVCHRAAHLSQPQLCACMSRPHLQPAFGSATRASMHGHMLLANGVQSCSSASLPSMRLLAGLPQGCVACSAGGKIAAPACITVRKLMSAVCFLQPRVTPVAGKLSPPRPTPVPRTANASTIQIDPEALAGSNEECFPGHVWVQTPHGRKQMRSLQLGDQVQTHLR